MIYASRTPESMKYRWSGGTYSGPEIEGTDAMLYVERVSEPPKTTHPANPILAALREDDDPDLEWWLTDNLNSWGDLWTPEQIDHARRVLTRLVQWGKVES